MATRANWRESRRKLDACWPCRDGACVERFWLPCAVLRGSAGEYRRLTMEEAPVAERDKAKAAEEVIRRSSAASAVAMLTPLSVFDVALLTPIQRRMVRDLMQIYGYQEGESARKSLFEAVRWKLAKADAAIVGAKALNLLRVVPVVGTLVAIAVASAVTQTLGELSHRYFADACSMSGGQLGACFDAIYKKQYTRKRDEVRAIWRAPEVRRQFVELLKAR